MTKSYTILLVEDEFLIGFALKAEITAHGHRVVGPVATGQDAVLAAERERPDLLLMDVRIAGSMDGVEAARLIRAFSKAPIFFMTGYSGEELLERTQDLAPVEVLQKPFEFEVLERALERYLA
jgi:CheY-like chemotaxis protein